jgi:hypothetical protein
VRGSRHPRAARRNPRLDPAALKHLERCRSSV